MNILFVCTGNTCRSPMAEYLFRKMLADAGVANVTVTSAGVAPAGFTKLPPPAIAVLKAEGVAQEAHAPRPLSRGLVAAADAILVMEDVHRALVRTRFPEAAGKVHLLKEYAGTARDPGGANIADPFGGSDADYERALRDIKNALANILAKQGDERVRKD